MNAFLIPLDWMLLLSICDHEKKEETKFKLLPPGKNYLPLSSSSKIVAISHPNNNHPPPPFTPGKLLPDSQPPPLADAYSNGYTRVPSVTPGVKRHGLFFVFSALFAPAKKFFMSEIFFLFPLSTLHPSSSSFVDRVFSS